MPIEQTLKSTNDDEPLLITPLTRTVNAIIPTAGNKFITILFCGFVGSAGGSNIVNFVFSNFFFTLVFLLNNGYSNSLF